MRRAAALAVLFATLAAGCQDGPGGPDGSPAQGTRGQQPPTPEDQLQALLRRRARALQRGQVDRYAATATGAQRAADRRAARNARGLPLRDVALRTRRIEVDGSRAVLRVRSGFGVRGIRGRFESDRTLRAVRTGRGWRIRSQTSRRRRHPWELARFTARRSRHFTVIAPAELPDGGLIAALEDGYGRMREILVSGTLRSRYLVVVAGDAAQARQLTSGIRGVATLAAISDAAVREQGEAERVVQVVSQRLLVVWPSFAPLDAEGRQRVITHELSHAALAGHTSGRTPSWLVEGIALYISGDDRTSEAASLLAGGASGRALSLTGLADPDAIGRLEDEAQSAAYAYSSAAAFHLVERFGRRRFLRLYDAFNDPGLAAPAGPDLLDRAVRRTLGTGLLALERDVRRSVLDDGLT